MKNLNEVIADAKRSRDHEREIVECFVKSLSDALNVPRGQKGIQSLVEENKIHLWVDEYVIKISIEPVKTEVFIHHGRSISTAINPINTKIFFRAVEDKESKSDIWIDRYSSPHSSKLIEDILDFIATFLIKTGYDKYWENPI